jgi:(p)ppGpp synthase/HD superfamily hydrolase
MKTPAQMLSTAIMIASIAHVDQNDRGGKPYILHTLRVMFNSSEDFEIMAAAVLHDAVEDRPDLVTWKYLQEAEMSERIIAAVKILTKTPGQTNEEYLAGILTNVDAMRIKRADLKDNSDLTRLKGVREKDMIRLQKYAMMYTVIDTKLKELGL